MPFKRPGQKFSVPENDRTVMTSWERFLNGGDFGSDALRRLVDDSWRRCLSGSVDPRRDQAPPPMREDTLYSLRDDCGELIEASAPVMASAREFLSETGTVMVLTNETGVILNLEGDSRLRDAAENIHLLSGATWSEMACGTNAIGTALEVGQPVQIHSAEHYCSGIKRWSCSANVIRDPFDGTILGVVDVSGLSETYNRHSLALVVATAGRIENRLAQLEMDVRFRLLERCMSRLSAPTSDGVIVFDRRGRAVKANGAASDALADLQRQRNDLPGTDLSSLKLDWKKSRELPEHLPSWVRREWLEPVVVEGERLGLVLVLPGRGSTPAPRAGAQDASGDARPKGGFARLIGEAPLLRQAIARAQQLAKSRAPALLLGETGVGKDVFAQCLHAESAGRDGPFVALNCGGFSRELLSSELFGYAEGAFTGARRGGMIGKIEAADGGTLFLDEIGEMPKDLQPHFLRVLESGEVYRIGETRPRKVNFRLISATNRDLRQEIQAGRFRMDLFYRVAVTSITIPALRERASDIPQLAAHLMQDLARRQGIEPRRLSPRVVDLFMGYAWPGNIRELRNVIESMLLIAEGPELTEADVPAEIWAGADPLAASAAAPEPFPAAWGLSGMEAMGSGPARGLTGMESAERVALLRAMQGHKGNVTAVARDLGLAKSTVYAKLRRFGLEGVVEEARKIQM
ncbi:sigma-54-dependent Fis family transcriptional regulator [Xanthobacter autotrophicus]|uniref:sigma-54-dependent Fis family transcriptional regulator n=1 Tax=Xanthobacter TaxID=279 RepID=UPI0024AC33BD|nr:sigma-54-dependent Fis family transcriptional regulator [Xanthobacter autotrophicus]MDI4663499.1 sigma-54-dependent Fis family transcriptional regulator [Xanthobacter autotrophicus]